MGRIIGLLLAVLGIWAATEVYLKGTAGAFGGLFADEGAAEPDGRSVARRAGDSVVRAHDEADARRERLLGDE